MGKLKISEKVEFTGEVEVKVENNMVVVKGAKGENSERIPPKVKVNIEGNAIIMTAENATRREKMQTGTLKAHLKNLIRGAAKEHVYALKVCSGHFPMNVSVSGKTLVVKNFFGEKVPRTVDFDEKVSIKVDGDKITVQSSSKRLAGQAAANIENATKRTQYDRRVFQDGIYITEKDGKALA